MTPPDHSSQALPYPGGRRFRAARSVPRIGGEGGVADRLQARKHRVRMIRRRVVAIAVATFLATSGGIFVQLASGNDPALLKSATPRATAAASTSGSNSTGSSASSGASSSGKATAVTTSAS